MQCKILYPIFFITFVFRPTRAGIDISELWNMQTGIIPLGRYYSLTRCLFKDQGGYTCVGCTTALHCYPTNGAIQVECRGLFRYCRNGFCSMSRGDKCVNADKVTESPSSNVTSHSGIVSEKPIMIEKEDAGVTESPARGNQVPDGSRLKNMLQEEDNKAVDMIKTSLRSESIRSFLKRYNLCRCWELNPGYEIENPTVL